MLRIVTEVFLMGLVMGLCLMALLLRSPRRVSRMLVAQMSGSDADGFAFPEGFTTPFNARNAPLDSEGRPRLVGLGGAYQGTTFMLFGGEVYIGRSQNNDVVLALDRKISRRHLLIEGDGDQFCITDLDSTNGTLVNGARLPVQTPQPLSIGDEIRIGHSRFRFQR